jgi:transcription initiation factor TFIIB
VEKTVLAKCVKSILPLVEEEIEVVSNENFVARFCSQLGLGIAIQNGAIEVVKRVDKMGFMAGKSPLTICAAAIYMVSQLSETPKSYKDIAPVAGVVEGTIRSAYSQLYAHRMEIFPPNMPRLKGIENLPADRPLSSGTASAAAAEAARLAAVLSQTSSSSAASAKKSTLSSSSK